MCICGWSLHFHSGCVAKLWAGSWVFLSQVPPSSSGHWTYEAPSSPPQTESDNNGPLERKRGVLSGRCLAEYQDQLSPSVNSETMQLSIAGVHTMSFPLTHKSCLTLSNKGTEGILRQFLSQPPCLLTNIVKPNLSNIMQLHLLWSYCVSAVCNVNSINTHTWKEGWFTHHKLRYKRGWHVLDCPRLFIAKRLQECCHCCSFTDISASRCYGFASLLCGRVSWLLLSFRSGIRGAPQPRQAGPELFAVTCSSSSAAAHCHYHKPLALLQRLLRKPWIFPFGLLPQNVFVFDSLFN